ncbi:MAG: hypothetical protein M3134_01400 [Actinomycetota bacterium]|nr:hypothetical protein [Actinomycetota bacterium]
MAFEVVDAATDIGTWFGHHVGAQVTVGALILGALGSGAHLAALLLGFLGQAPIDEFMPYFTTFKAKRRPRVQVSRRRVAAFVFFGGGVAAAFQLAQPDVFAPVQSLVLGATWPTVISQIMSRSAETDRDKTHALGDDIDYPGPEV